jgi:hypothetical protein
MFRNAVGVMGIPPSSIVAVHLHRKGENCFTSEYKIGYFRQSSTLSTSCNMRQFVNVTRSLPLKLFSTSDFVCAKSKSFVQQIKHLEQRDVEPSICFSYLLSEAPNGSVVDAAPGSFHSLRSRKILTILLVIKCYEGI